MCKARPSPQKVISDDAKRPFDRRSGTATIRSLSAQEVAQSSCLDFNAEFISFLTSQHRQPSCSNSDDVQAHMKPWQVRTNEFGPQKSASSSPVLLPPLSLQLNEAREAVLPGKRGAELRV